MALYRVVKKAFLKPANEVTCALFASARKSCTTALPSRGLQPLDEDAEARGAARGKWMRMAARSAQCSPSIGALAEGCGEWQTSRRSSSLPPRHLRRHRQQQPHRRARLLPHHRQIRLLPRLLIRSRPQRLTNRSTAPQHRSRSTRSTYQATSSHQPIFRSARLTRPHLWQKPRQHMRASMA